MAITTDFVALGATKIQKLEEQISQLKNLVVEILDDMDVASVIDETTRDDYLGRLDKIEKDA